MGYNVPPNPSLLIEAGIYIHTYIHTYILTYIHVCMYVYIYIYISALSTPHAIVSSINATSAQRLSLLWKVWLRKYQASEVEFKICFNHTYGIYIRGPLVAEQPSLRKAPETPKSRSSATLRRRKRKSSSTARRRKWSSSLQWELQ